MGCWASEAVRLVTPTPPVALRQHLLNGQLGDKEEAFEIGGDQSPKILGGVVREGFKLRRRPHC